MDKGIGSICILGKGEVPPQKDEGKVENTKDTPTTKIVRAISCVMQRYISSSRTAW